MPNLQGRKRVKETRRHAGSAGREFNTVPSIYWDGLPPILQVPYIDEHDKTTIVAFQANPYGMPIIMQSLHKRCVLGMLML
jgi:hypothetical protein